MNKATQSFKYHSPRRSLAALVLAAGMAITLGTGARAVADPVTTAITYQAGLQAAGVPVNGSHDMRFRLYDSGVGGSQVGPTLCIDNLMLVDGQINVSLEFGSVFDGQRRFLEIELRPDTGLDCSDPTGMTVLTPRQELTAAPHAAYALAAGTATTAASATTATSATNAINATNATLLGGQAAAFFQDAANLTGTLADARLWGAYSGALTLSNAANAFTGVGTGLTALNATNLTSGTLPTARLSGTYSSAVTLSNAANAFTGVGTGLTELNATNIASGTIPDARLSANVPLENQANAFGAFDNTFAGQVGIGMTSPAYPLNFASVLGDKISLYGTATNHYGLGVQSNTLQIHTNTSAADIVFGYGSSAALTETARITGDGRLAVGIGAPDDTALHTFTNSRSSSATVETSLAGGVALNVLASATTLDTVAGSFTSSSNNGTGLYAIATRASGVTYGLRAYVNSNAANAMAVRGECTNNGANYGVYGSATGASAFGVYSNGRLGSSGTKSFMIDHPLDPENKFLLHYSLESPEVLNVYTGVVSLDAAGEAWVTLPEYYESINIEPRYMLTSVGAPAPMLHVAEEVTGNRFKIAGGAPSAKVSWEIKARRNDKFVQQNGAPVERVKVEGEKGTYQIPELYGKPASMGQFYTPPRELPVRTGNTGSPSK
ncbi:MAG: hypothetical protein AABZ53_11415 [Planctomycetota bacterium]